MSVNKRARHFERGTSMVETAIVMGVFLMIVFGIIDFSRALYDYHMVDNAARLGARFAIVRGSTCVHTATPDPWPCPTPTDGSQISQYVQEQAPLLGPGSLTVTTAWGDPATGGPNPGCTAASSPYNAPGCLVTVTVSYPFKFLIPLVSTVGFTITSSSQMVIAQ